jgi:AcrR family transcriptional regulator
VVQVPSKTSGKRERVVEAARELFLAHGLRGTSMEAIARRAGVAKPTLYAHFPDKDAVFLAILEALLTEKLAIFEKMMATELPVAERIGQALAAEFAVVVGAIEGSPHRAELFGEHRRAAALMEQSDAQVSARIAAELRQAGVAEPERLVNLLLAAAFGLVQRGGGGAQLSQDIALVAERLIGPALPQATARR